MITEKHVLNRMKNEDEEECEELNEKSINEEENEEHDLLTGSR